MEIVATVISIAGFVMSLISWIKSVCTGKRLDKIEAIESWRIGELANGLKALEEWFGLRRKSPLHDQDSKALVDSFQLAKHAVGMRLSGGVLSGNGKTTSRDDLVCAFVLLETESRRQNVNSDQARATAESIYF